MTHRGTQKATETETNALILHALSQGCNVQLVFHCARLSSQGHKLEQIPYLCSIYQAMYPNSTLYLPMGNNAIFYIEPVILECEVKWALESITMNKASG